MDKMKNKDPMDFITEHGEKTTIVTRIIERMRAQQVYEDKVATG